VDALIANARKPAEDKVVCVINTSLSSSVDRSARRIAAAVTEISGLRTVIVHYSLASRGNMKRVRPVAIILSGQGDPWTSYRESSLRDVKSLIRAADYPLLGICGGHQLVALAFGGTVDRIRRVRPGEGYDGCLRESGYRRARVVADDPVLGRKGSELFVCESHYDEVKREPAGFVTLATNATSRIQAMRHRSKLIYGVQFHPDIWDKAHPAGKEILERFLQLCSKWEGRRGRTQAPRASVGSEHGWKRISRSRPTDQLVHRIRMEGRLRCEDIAER